ncbi:MAG: hydroxymethylglutaryl-CoA lyase, partial [Planctomycetota bacterium]
MTQPLHITDVGPRDGLQNLAVPVPLDVKIKLVRGLADAGVKEIEVGSFVNPKLVPQMADTAELFREVADLKDRGVVLSALVPNERGLDAALEAGASKIAVFASVTETFSQRNTGGSCAEVHERLVPVVYRAKEAGLPVRGYLSCVFGDPFEPANLTHLAWDARQRMHDLAVNELDLGDTFGTADPASVEAVIKTYETH